MPMASRRSASSRRRTIRSSPKWASCLSAPSALGSTPALSGSLRLTLGPAITLSPSFFTLPADAQIIVAVPDIMRLRDSGGQLVVHAGDSVTVPVNPTDPGVWLVYPKLD